MADTNIQLPSLPAASSTTSGDLLHIRQGAIDKKIDVDALKSYFESAGLSAQDMLDLIITVDGGGSGLDADLLDGQHGSYYRNAGNLNAGIIPAARLPAISSPVRTSMQYSGASSTVGTTSKTQFHSITYNHDGGGDIRVNGVLQIKNNHANPNEIYWDVQRSSGGGPWTNVYSVAKTELNALGGAYTPLVFDFKETGLAAGTQEWRIVLQCNDTLITIEHRSIHLQKLY